MIELMCLAGITILIGGAIFCGWLLAKIMDWRWTRKEAKRKKEHPHLFELVRERNALSCKIGDWYRKEILARKEEIDLIVKENIYLPADIKAKKEKGLEQLRNELYAAQMEDARMEVELAGIRAKIADYVINNNLKWAKERGWDSN
jgi:hypothetical protein